MMRDSTANGYMGGQYGTPAGNLRAIYDGYIYGNDGTLPRLQDLMDNEDIVLHRLGTQLETTWISTARVSGDLLDKPKDILFSAEAAFRSPFILL